MVNPPATSGEFSRSQFRGAGAYPPLDPMKVVAYFESFICALILVVLIWSNRSNSLGYWRFEETAIWALVCYAPIANLLWSAIPRLARPRYIWLRRTIQIHAIAAVCITVAGCTGLARGWHPLAVLYGAMAFGALLIDLTVLGLSPWAIWDAEDIETYRVAQLKVAGGAVAALLVWSFANIGLVIGQSELIAWGRPYCLQVAGKNLGYKPVSYLMELNGLKMHTPFTSGGGSGEFQTAYHGVLVMDLGGALEWRHWSYTMQHFIRHSDGRGIGKPICEPRSQFGFQLSVW